MDSTFAVPALPRREGHGSRPLSMSKTQNLSGSPLTSDHHHPEAKQVNNSGANRLKRLSLVARPPIREAPASPQRAPGHTNTTPSTPGPQPAGGPSHRRAMGMRSSISYSPALARREASSHEETRSEFETWAEERGYFGEMIAGPSRSSGKRSSVQSLEGSCPEAKNKDDDRRGETFVERHADLLTLIAQKERRVNDLRQELASQEASLNQLKTRWTAIISKSAPPAPSRPVRAGHHPLSGTSTIRPSPIEPPQTLAADPGPAAEHATGTNSTALTPSDGQSLASFITSLGTTPEGLLGQDTIEGGKRFWTQLVKTVSAAAGGTVPDAQSPQPSKVDIGPLKSMLAWPSEPSRPALPANASRLNKKRPPADLTPSSSLASVTTSSASVTDIDLLGDLDDDAQPLSESSLASLSSIKQRDETDEAWGW